jgi:hypothetical protein
MPLKSTICFFYFLFFFGLFTVYNAVLHRTPLSNGIHDAEAGQPDLEAYLDTVVLQAEMSPEPLCGPAVETMSVCRRVNKQLVAAQEDDPWGTSLAVQDPPAVQVKRLCCAAPRCPQVRQCRTNLQCW